MPTLEVLDGLDPLNAAHTCPRCREAWAYRDQASIGAVAWVVCPNGHRGSVLVFDLPAESLSFVATG